ncbi:hypothetical protein NQ318_008076 [Aromia moschata]|uniref:Uncharacterized protein n=1 Tax=Aromia moschata TaxID=1265417 RepID=A0AAV8YQ93_9CUCU|nr:hypothetical protein NQ318_008076 [Aromia moschata]
MAYEMTTNDNCYGYMLQKSFYSNGKPNRRNEHCWATENPYYVDPMQKQGYYGINCFRKYIKRYADKGVNEGKIDKARWRIKNYEKFNMLECFIQNGYNSEAASEAYFNRYPKRRQPNMSIFGRLKENLVEYGGFNKPRPKNYRIQDAEDVAINVVGMVVQF